MTFFVFALDVCEFDVALVAVVADALSALDSDRAGVAVATVQEGATDGVVDTRIDGDGVDFSMALRVTGTSDESVVVAAQPDPFGSSVTTGGT